MDSEAVRKLAEALKNGEFPDAQPWDLGAAVELIVADIGPQPDYGDRGKDAGQEPSVR